MKSENAIWNARELGIPKMLILGLQHTFAMFGATVLVPIITGLDVSTTLLFRRCLAFKRGCQQNAAKSDASWAHTACKAAARTTILRWNKMYFGSFERK